jgi:hypothetical protein
LWQKTYSCGFEASWRPDQSSRGVASVAR